jgi:hypothetical protein
MPAIDNINITMKNVKIFSQITQIYQHMLLIFNHTIAWDIY